MYFDRNFRGVDQMNMVRSIHAIFIKDIAQSFYKINDALFTAFNPQVYIASMSHKRIRVKSCVSSPFQHSRFTALRFKNICKPCRLSI